MPKRETKLQVVVIDGKEIPVVTEERLAEHEAVKSAIAEAKKLQAMVVEKKKKITGMVDTVLDRIAQKYGEEWKGNAGLYSIDESLKVIVKVSFRILFTNEIAIAKQKYDTWLNSLEGCAELKRLTKKKFRTDSEGYIPKGPLATLYAFASDDPIKKEADQIYKKAKKLEIRKPYYNFYEKDGNEWKRVEVNFSEV